ncbi:GntR family transcriptional regulator [Mesorhizobium retamae]|uniref:GntR family transcriptional regulator n=1 Tax=Mesorhizobium retamae TaxID=2912854 RepID=A0ABS9QK59_9HYPH|nr:GntR family transcriptional regulator [Mesorhizobium sp. IRAMC:0171]MCG7507832.1 GntR family transcriptional regulator [Mesorhizobium sp. IRAMC:0171]
MTSLPEEHTYERIAREITAELTDGMWRDGDALPSEAALTISFNVSRKTIRRALDIVARSGLVDRAQGKHSIVRNPRIEKAVGQATDFSAETRKAGLRPRSRLDSVKVRGATLGEAVHLGLTTGADVFEIVRTRLIEGLPVVWQTSALPAQFAQKLDNLDRSSGSLYGAIKLKLGIEITQIEDRLSIVAARPKEAASLRVAEGTPLISMRRIARTGDGQPIELSVSLIRPEFFVFQTSRKV